MKKLLPLLLGALVLCGCRPAVSPAKQLIYTIAQSGMPAAASPSALSSSSASKGGGDRNSPSSRPGPSHAGSGGGSSGRSKGSGGDASVSSRPGSKSGSGSGEVPGDDAPVSGGSSNKGSGSGSSGSGSNVGPAAPGSNGDSSGNGSGGNAPGSGSGGSSSNTDSSGTDNSDGGPSDSAAQAIEAYNAAAAVMRGLSALEFDYTALLTQGGSDIVESGVVKYIQNPENPVFYVKQSYPKYGNSMEYYLSGGLLRVRENLSIGGSTSVYTIPCQSGDLVKYLKILEPQLAAAQTVSASMSQQGADRQILIEFGDFEEYGDVFQILEEPGGVITGLSINCTIGAEGHIKKITQTFGILYGGVTQTYELSREYRNIGGDIIISPTF